MSVARMPPFVPAHWSRLRVVLFSALWLVFLARPVAAALERNPQPPGQLLTILVTAAFGLLYLSLFWTAGRSMRPATPYLVVAGLAACTIGLCLLAGGRGLLALVYLAALGGVLFAPVAAGLWGVGLVAVGAVLPLLVAEWEFSAAVPFAVAMATVASLAFSRLLQRNRQLLAAQEEIGRLAVAQERLRFSRDLHDTLGHNLTLIAMKAELASSQAGSDPERSVDEISDVHRLARESLAELRAAVAGYRTTSLHSELAHARQALSAAEIATDLPEPSSPELDPSTLPPARQELFGWVVREAVTNTVRHSKATSCTVRVTTTSVEVVNNGPGVDSSDARSVGHGLAGLTERVRAAGGTLTAGRTDDGGFRLFVEVPP